MATSAKKLLDLKAKPRSTRDVTAFLAQHHIEGVRLERGRGFFYFAGGPVLNWLNRTVVTPVIGSRTLGEWLAEYRRMAKQNISADPFMPKTMRKALGRRR
jgi:hypothetical protein